MTVYGLVASWVVIFLLRVLLKGDGGPMDVAALWMLRLLGVIIAVQLLTATVRFLMDLSSAARRGEKVFTDERIHRILGGGLIIGLALRVWGWDSEGQGVPDWAGAVLVCASLVGLGVMYLQRARKSQAAQISFWHPFWRAGLFAAWVTSLTALGAAGPDGVVGGLFVALFWLSLIALAVQVLGGSLHRSPNH